MSSVPANFDTVCVCQLSAVLATACWMRRNSMIFPNCLQLWGFNRILETLPQHDRDYVGTDILVRLA